MLNNNGEWIKKNSITDYSVNLVKGQVTFNKPIGKPPVDGRDSVRIQYKVSSVSNKSQVNKCDIMSVYGYAGANNRIFIAGNPDYPNILMYSHLEDITYIPVENVIKIGLEVVPITGIVRLNNSKLAVLKDI